ncbi:fumarylacetoacetate hydrolase family protein [Nocardia blacklockiae]|uniref:fumarylacetoacetate hydrolase family protein n=1 Tax=Nocardia blacklockiae TaxID=480036 RepID=UPI0018930FF2|nr:fumarylacetoacetate hydrolase family protein [Nocardia blacklockiae]MBF6170687.1 fumarylacetoacetate hydrolase family protein [Nocardia blacklockiae]
MTAADQLATTGFGSTHLPYGSYSTATSGPRLGVRLGDHVLNAAALLRHTDASPADLAAVDTGNLDVLLTRDRATWDRVRTWIAHAVEDPDATESIVAEAVPLTDCTLHLPFTVADYVDFYGNEFHASNVGRIFRPGQPPLTPNWKHLPIGYHGRAGTIVPSGTDIPRPKGLRPEPDGTPTFGPSRRLDIEVEVGFVLGSPVPQGQIALGAAADHIFGLVLTNDWSARDIQAFEYVPLGPFLGKSFATSIAAWVTPLPCLDHARVAPPPREVPLAAYLDDSTSPPWAFDFTIDVVLNGETVSTAPYATTYWTAAQMLSHLTVNGATLRAGDFFASGTISGPARHQRGSFLEISWGGTDPLPLTDGTEITFLRDGDEVTLRATAPGPSGTTLTFGECTGRILP